jgi:hypothetical protein
MIDRPARREAAGGHAVLFQATLKRVQRLKRAAEWEINHDPKAL